MRLAARFRDRARALLWAKRTASRPVLKPPKTYTPKCPQLPRLPTYKGAFPRDYWDVFPKYKPKTWHPESWIDGDSLLSEAREAGVDNLTDALFARDACVNGADTGVRGRGRDPTAGRNQPSAYEYGHLLSDALGAWVQAGLMAGPYTLDEVKAVFGSVKISPMGIQLKPSGAGRIIVDMSYPHLPGKPNVFGSEPLSCNASIDASEFPAAMSSTRDVVDIILRHGPGTTFCKQVSCDT